MTECVRSLSPNGTGLSVRTFTRVEDDSVLHYKDINLRKNVHACTAQRKPECLASIGVSAPELL